MKVESRDIEEDQMIKEMNFSEELMVKDWERGSNEEKNNHNNTVVGMLQKDVSAAYFKHISLQDKKALYDIYKYDFELFGYRPDPSILSF